MKTIIATLIIALSLNLNASNLNLALEDEAYINDIPFNTEEVVANYLYEKALAVKFEMAEEEYIDYITFNTECIAADCLYKMDGQVSAGCRGSDQLPADRIAFGYSGCKDC